MKIKFDEETFDGVANDIEEVALPDEVERKYAGYTFYTIADRALVDVIDGLKPVQRRILFTMHKNGFTPSKSHTKSARIVGATMGEYHPHGDTGIYDAMVRLAQSSTFSLPVVDGQGNFGGPGLDAAASRYCLTGDTRVLMPDGSSVRIDKLVDLPEDSETDLDTMVADWAGQPVHVSKGFNSGAHPVYTVTTESNQRIRGSANHPLLAVRKSDRNVYSLEWVTLDSLLPGDALYVPLGDSRDTSETLNPTGLLLGAWAAEGWYSEKRAKFSTTDEEYFALVLDALDKVCGVTREVKHRALPTGEVIKEIDLRGNQIEELNRTVLNVFRGNMPADKHIPELVWESGPAMQRAFLASVFEGGGGIRPASDTGRGKTGTITYASTSEKLVSDIQEMLLSFGICSTSQTSDVYGQPTHVLQITSEYDVLRFLDRIGFVAAKRVQVPQVHITSSTSMVSDFFITAVRAVEKGAPEPVYSVKVDSDDHSFIAGGFVNHNTEARLSSFGMLMTEELADKVVDMKPNYDDSTEEPVVLPAQVPLLLINGTTGIAVAMASNMAPHNPVESINACIYQLEHQDAWEAIKNAGTPEVRLEKTRTLVGELMKVLPGPDFPTGGQLLGTEGIEEAYSTGIGRVVIRAQYTIEPDKRGKNRIIFHDFPYGVNAVGILKQLAEAEEKFLSSTRTIRENGGKGKVEGYQISGIESVDDFSDGENATRLEVLVDSKTNPEIVAAELFKRTRLEGTFNFNQNCLVNGTPKVVTLPELIQHFLKFRLAVVTRRSESELQKRKDRHHLLAGLLKVLVVIDEAIKIIRGSESQEKAAEGLKKKFKIDDIQAKHILDTPLRRLTKMDSLDLEKEQQNIEERVEHLETLLGNEEMQRAIVKEELLKAVERIKADDGEYGFTYKRKSVLANVSFEEYASEMEEALSMSREVQDDPCTLYLDVYGKVSRTARKPYVNTLQSSVLGTYVAITNRGRGFRASVLDGVTSALPSDEKIVALVDQEHDGIIGTKHGVVLAFKPNFPTRSDEFPIINLGEGDEVVGGGTLSTETPSEVVFLSNDASLLRYGADKVAAKATLNGKGMAGMKLADNAEVLAFKVIPETKVADTRVVTYTGASAKVTALSEYPSKGRATGGVRAHRFLKGESVLQLARVGTKVQAVTPEGEVQTDLSAYEGRRDGSGIKMPTALSYLAGE